MQSTKHYLFGHGLSQVNDHRSQREHCRLQRQVMHGNLSAFVDARGEITHQ
jgi:hypothetical protein